jgi:hypothetical protein
VDQKRNSGPKESCSLRRYAYVDDGAKSIHTSPLRTLSFSGLPSVKTIAGKGDGPVRRSGVFGDRSLTLALFSASGAFFLLLLAPLFRGLTFIAGDLLIQNLPYRKFYADCLHHHDSFLWCPFLYGGFYLHGEGQAGMMHPFHLLLYSVLPLTTAFSIEILSTYVFMFAGCYLLFRAWKLSTPAALFGGFLFTFAGTNLDLLRHMNAIAVVAHLPWLLLAIDRAFGSAEPRTRALWLGAAALLTGSQVLVGYPQYVYFCALIEGGYALYLMAVKVRWWRLLEVAGALVVGLLIGGAQLLPTASALHDSARVSPPIGFLSEMSLQPQELLQWINPLVWQGGRYHQLRGAYNLFIYCGGTVTLLLFVWVLSVKDLDGPRRKLARFLGVVGFAALFMALGKYNLVFPLYARLPVIGLFRAPVRYTVLTDFAVAAGAALALDHLKAIGGKFSLSPFVRRVAMFFAVGSLATVAIALLSKITKKIGIRAGASILSELAPHLAKPSLVMAGALMVVAGAVLFLVAARVPRISYSGLAIFVLLDVLCIQGMALLLHNETGNPFHIANPPPIPAPGPVQVKIQDDHLVLLDYRLVDGFSGLEPASPIPIRSDVYARITGARAVLDGVWKVLPDPLPLLRLRNRAVLMLNREALLIDSKLIADSSLMEHPYTPPGLDRDLEQVTHFDFSKAALVDAPLSLDPNATGSLDLIEDHPGQMKLVASVTGSMLCTVGERFHPGWKIRLDDKPQEIVRVDGSLLGFVVPEGRHLIECRFDPDDFRYGKLISLFGVLITLLYLAIVFAWFKT